MFCTKCGTKNEIGAKFCKSCGAPLIQPESGVQNETQPEGGINSGNAVGSGSEISSGNAGGQPDFSAAPQAAAKKKFPKKLIIGLAAAAAAIIIIVCLVTNAGKAVNLNDYLVIDAHGYNGDGNASVTIDWNAIEEDYGSKLSIKWNEANIDINDDLSINLGLVGGLIDNFVSPIDVMRQFVSVELSQTSGLSNGDVISYTWTIDEDLTKYVDCTIKYTDGDYTVSDLITVGESADLTVALD